MTKNQLPNNECFVVHTIFFILRSQGDLDSFMTDCCFAKMCQFSQVQEDIEQRLNSVCKMAKKAILLKIVS